LKGGRPPLGASVTLKISKNEFEARKLWPPKVKGVEKFSIEQIIAYFGTPQKILKSYSVAFRVTK